MKLFKHLHLLLCTLLLISFTASAEQAEQRKESDRKIPILIGKLNKPSIASSKLTKMQENLSKVIVRDLEKSGAFTILDRNDFLHAASYTTEPVYDNSAKYDAWKKAGLQYLVVLWGSFHGPDKSGKNVYEIEFQFLDVNKRKQIVGYNFLAPINEIPGLGHFIADEIHEQLFGVRSDFNSTIAFIRVDKERAKKYSIQITHMGDLKPQTALESDKLIEKISFSPAGQFLAYVSYENDRPELFVHNLHTAKRKRFDLAKKIVGAFNWSPDSRYLALTLAKNNTQGIYILNVLTEQLINQTPDKYINRSPVWSLDGTSVTYISERPTGQHIYRTSVRNKNTIKQSDTFNKHDSLISPIPVFSDDLYSANGTELRRVDLKNGTSTIIADSGSSEIVGTPSISPNNSMFIFGTRKNGRGTIKIQTIGTGKTWELSDRKADLQSPTWGPNKSVNIYYANSNTQMTASVSKLVPNALHQTGNNAVSGDVRAAKQLALAFLNGEDGHHRIEKNHIVAEYFFKAAAKKGDPTALRYLAKMYYQGDIVEKNYALSVKYYRQLAQKHATYNPTYKDLVRSLIALGGTENIKEAVEWMNKEMKAKSIESSANISNVSAQFKYLYQGGYQVERRAAIEKKRADELAALVKKTGKHPLPYGDLLVNFTKRDEAIDLLERLITSQFLSEKLFKGKIFGKNIEKTYTNPVSGVEIICFGYRSKYSSKNTNDCLIIEKGVLVGFKLDRSQFDSGAPGRWGFNEAMQLKKGFVKVLDEKNGNTHRRQWVRKGQKLNSVIWGEFQTTRYRMVGNVKHFSGYRYGIQSTVCVFPNHLEQLLEKQKAVRNNYTCS